MIYRLWAAHRKSAAYDTSPKPRLLYIARILVESAALQLIVEIVLLALYCQDINAQYILLESVTSIVVLLNTFHVIVSLIRDLQGITFNAITIRLRLHAMAESASGGSGSQHAVQTIGSVPMRRIHVNIAKDVEQQHDDENMESFQKNRSNSD